jgi:hypothetical protein
VVVVVAGCAGAACGVAVSRQNRQCAANRVALHLHQLVVEAENGHELRVGLDVR